MLPNKQTNKKTWMGWMHSKNTAMVDCVLNWLHKLKIIIIHNGCCFWKKLKKKCVFMWNEIKWNQNIKLKFHFISYIIEVS